LVPTVIIDEETKKRRLGEALERAPKINLSGLQKPTTMKRPSLAVSDAIEIEWKLLRRF